MKKVTFLFILSAVLSLYAPAAMVTIEADNFAAGTNLTNSITDFTIKTSGPSSYYIENGLRWCQVYALDTGTLFQDASGVLYPLGQRVLGFDYKGSFYPYFTSDTMLKVAFNGLAKSVYLETASPGNPQSITILRGYDQSGNQILYRSTNRSVRTSSPEIIHYEFDDYQLAYVEIYGYMTVVDNLQFDVQSVPEPSTLLLGIGGLCVKRKLKG